MLTANFSVFSTRNRLVNDTIDVAPDEVYPEMQK